MTHPYTPGSPVLPGYQVISIPATSWRGDEMILVQVPLPRRTPPGTPPAAPAPLPRGPRRPSPAHVRV